MHILWRYLEPHRKLAALSLLLAGLSGLLSREIKAQQRSIVRETARNSGFITESLRNIELIKSAMRRGRDRHRQTVVHGDALPEAEQLHRDLALVVVHGQHAVVAVTARLAGRAHEGGYRPGRARPPG